MSIDGFDALFDARLLIVTGKGGVGKTTVAAVLGLAAVASGRRTLLVEVEGRHSLSRTFETARWDFEEREFRPGLWGVALDPAEAVLEYLELFYGLRRVGWVMERTNALDFVTAAAPGLRDLLLIGKVYEIESRRTTEGRRTYDLIIVDAPPTGRIVPFLSAPTGVLDIVRVGPIRRQTGHIVEMLRNPRRTAAVVVTLLEEMPVTEAIEAVEGLHGIGVRVGPIVCNAVTVPRLDTEAAELLLTEPDTAFVGRLAGAGLPTTLAATARALVGAHRARLGLEAELREELRRRTDRPLLELPLVTRPTFGIAELELLAEALAAAVGEPAPRLGELLR